jgi:uncharacterized damage-inducible protein DinB
VEAAPLLLEIYGRIPPLAEGAVDGLSKDQLTWRPAPDANTIAWLIWHLARVQDHHIAELLDTEQLWSNGEWGPRFGLESDPANTGYGHTPEQVGAVRPEGSAALTEYLAEVDRQTRRFLESVEPQDLERIVDRRWDPPVTMAVRLVSIADDCLQHVGQAAYVRGLLDS